REHLKSLREVQDLELSSEAPHLRLPSSSSVPHTTDVKPALGRFSPNDKGNEPESLGTRKWSKIELLGDFRLHSDFPGRIVPLAGTLLSDGCRVLTISPSDAVHLKTSAHKSHSGPAREACNKIFVTGIAVKKEGCQTTGGYARPIRCQLHRQRLQKF